MRSEQHHARLAQLSCVRAPGNEAFRPVRTALVPGNQQQAHLGRRRQLARVIEALNIHSRAGARIGDAGGDHQVARDDGDRHSARAGSGFKVWTGCGCTPFDPLRGMPSIT